MSDIISSGWIEMIEFGFSFDFTQPLSDIVKQVQFAEKCGFDFVVVPDCVPYPKCRDVFITLGLLASKTSRLHIGTGIVNPYSRHPLMIACAINSLQEATNGRAFVTLGAGSRMSLSTLGLFPPHRPIRALREATEILMSLRSGKSLSYKGVLYHVDNAVLDPIPSPPFPVYLSGRGKQVLQLLGEIGDGGFALIPCEAADVGMGLIYEGARKGKRSITGLKFGLWIPTYISSDNPRKYVHQLKLHVFFSVAQTPDIVNRKMGIGPSMAANMRKALSDRGYRVIDTMVTDEMIEKYALVGSKDKIIEQIEIAIKAGFNRFIFGEPHGETTQKGLQQIADTILPHFSC
ncbi:MAG: LLM class flavin-dependent oxidoreductase [Candidatus Ranarchaeia archaeon]